MLLCVGDSPSIKQEALNLALKYNFVTELTSLIVVQESILEKVPRENISLYATHGDKETGHGRHEKESFSASASLMAYSAGVSRHASPYLMATSVKSRGAMMASMPAPQTFNFKSVSPRLLKRKKQPHGKKKSSFLPQPDSSLVTTPLNETNTTATPPPKDVRSPRSRRAFSSHIRSPRSEDEGHFSRVSKNVAVAGCLNTISALYTINRLC